jgi:branched-chain amino acid aminotransferase
MAVSYQDRNEWIWLDGEMLPWRDARLHVLTNGLHYAGTVFEGERAYNGHIFKLGAHSERFVQSARLLGFAIPLDVTALDDISREILHANKISEGYIRPVAWRGSDRMDLGLPDCGVHVAVACWEWPDFFRLRPGGTRGISLKIADWRRPHPATAPVHAKASGLYMTGTLAKHAAERAGYDDALMLDYRGYVAEATAANFFAVKDGVLHTPAPDCFLDGITRRTIIGLAKNLGMAVEQTHILPGDLAACQEAFITGTAVEVTPVYKIDSILYKAGPVTARLAAAYADLVRQSETAARAA